MTSGLLLVLWFRVWLPYVDVNDPHWLLGHSYEEACAEMAGVVRTCGWTHDMTLEVQWCGPEWVGTIVADARELADARLLDDHRGLSLQVLTGQRIGIADAEGWEEWYARNAGRTEDDWYSDAFAQAGLALSHPLDEEDAYGLLEWLATDHDDGPPSFTAYRALRHSQVMVDILRRGPTRPLTPAEGRGLARYAMFEGRRFAPEGPVVSTPIARVVPVVVLVSLTVFSAFALGRSTRRGVLASATSAGSRPSGSKGSGASVD